jgi:hypothetical protein
MASKSKGGKPPKKPPAAKTPAKTAAKKARPRAGKAAAKATAPAAGGPVTLAEARKLAMAQQPQMAAGAIAKSAAPGPSPATVGAERERLRKETQQEFERRIRDYKATMAIMKRHGARAPAATGGAPKMASPQAAVAFQPLQAFAEGDSWFDYPYPLFGGGIIPRLERRVGVPILNLAKAGDEVRYMLGVDQRKLLRQHLSTGCPAGGPWDVLLFSGGGNDIVDNPMALWIREWKAGLTPAQLVHQPRLDAALALVRAGYEDLITLRDELSPGTHIVLHAYDFALADGRKACHLGPWLKPTFDLRSFPDVAARNAVVRHMLEQFAALLASLAGPTVTLINAQSTLPPVKDSWHNELHPTRDGFERFADIFHARLKQLFPSRVV